jgi:magnesium transporter
MAQTWVSLKHPDGEVAKDEEHAIRCAVYSDGQPTQAPDNLDDISDVLKQPGKLVWLDVASPTAVDYALLKNEFNLHPLALEDAATPHERPKIEAFDGYYFLIVHGATVSPSGIKGSEIAIFAAANYIITIRRDASFSLDEIEKRWLAKPADARKSSSGLLYVILDTIVDRFFDVADAVDDEIQELEAALFRGATVVTVIPRKIFSLKRDLQYFRRAVAPLRDVLNAILREDIPLFARTDLAYFRDVYDHAIRVIDQIDAARDLVNGALDLNLSLVANRQNEVVKQLTIIATVFMPLTFITGFFGQNFAFMVAHIQTPASFYIFGFGTEILAIVLLVIFFKVRRWF